MVFSEPKKWRKFVKITNPKIASVIKSKIKKIKEKNKEFIVIKFIRIIITQFSKRIKIKIIFFLLKKIFKKDKKIKIKNLLLI